MPWTASPELAARLPVSAVAADEEALPLRQDRLDLVVGSLALHWVNDLPGALVQIRRALRPDGLFLAALFGGETLWELREVLIEAELTVSGGVSARVSPMADLRDAAGLLQRAGFALPVADRDPLSVSYADAWALMRDLSKMGESNAIRLRAPGPLRRAILAEAVGLYQKRHAMVGGRVRASFRNTIYLRLGARCDSAAAASSRPSDRPARRCARRH